MNHEIESEFWGDLGNALEDPEFASEYYKAKSAFAACDTAYQWSRGFDYGSLVDNLSEGVYDDEQE